MTYENPSTLLPGALRLPDGCYRRLDAGDARRLKSHLLRLHPDDVHNRFMGSKQHAAITRYVRAIDWRTAIIVGCFLGRSMRGACELYPIDERRAEVAVSVERRFQRRGIAREMLARTLIFARNRGFVELEFRCFTNNGKMRGLVRGFDGKVDVEAMEATAVIHAPRPTPSTYLSEMVEQAGMVGSSLMRLWLHTHDRVSDRCLATPDMFAPKS